MRAVLLSLILISNVVYAKDVLIAKCGSFGIFDTVYGNSHNILISDGSDEIQMNGKDAKVLDGANAAGHRFHLEMQGSNTVTLTETIANKPQRKLSCERVNSDAVKAALNAPVFGTPTAATVASEPDWAAEDAASHSPVELSDFDGASR